MLRDTYICPEVLMSVQRCSNMLTMHTYARRYLKLPRSAHICPEMLKYANYAHIC